jgi:TRAP-type C4-dicarboxylate transport system permease large subunit
METGGISRRLIEFSKSIVGGVQGGLPMSTCVLTCMIFAAVSRAPRWPPPSPSGPS